MSAFNTFIQLELPLRPFMDNDVEEETLIIRRGPGPRQITALNLAEGEVPVVRSGVLVGEAKAAGTGAGSYCFNPLVSANAAGDGYNILFTNDGEMLGDFEEVPTPVT